MSGRNKTLFGFSNPRKSYVDIDNVHPDLNEISHYADLIEVALSLNIPDCAIYNAVKLCTRYKPACSRDELAFVVSLRFSVFFRQRMDISCLMGSFINDATADPSLPLKIAQTEYDILLSSRCCIWRKGENIFELLRHSFDVLFISLRGQEFLWKTVSDVCWIYESSRELNRGKTFPQSTLIILTCAIAIVCKSQDIRGIIEHLNHFYPNYELGNDPIVTESTSLLLSYILK